MNPTLSPIGCHSCPDLHRDKLQQESKRRPAKAGTYINPLDSRFHGNDEKGKYVTFGEIINNESGGMVGKRNTFKTTLFFFTPLTPCHPEELL